MRLTDSAPLIVAKELGLYDKYGIDVTLVREVSWANLRDRLVMGELDAAQMLAPLPMMTTHGAGGIRGDLLTGLTLSLNGNAITLSNQLFASLCHDTDNFPLDPRVSSKNLLRHVEGLNQKPALTFATVHLFSTHTQLLRLWLNASGIDVDRDVKIIVLPPQQMCDSLARGIIDGFCVGEPWNSYAVINGIGSVICTGYQVWNNAPEKVLAVSESWQQTNAGSHLRLRLALMEACQWLAENADYEGLATLLGQQCYLNLPVKYLLPSLSGDFQFTKQAPACHLDDFHVHWKYQAGFPWHSDARRLLQGCSKEFARPLSDSDINRLTQQCYRTDLYRDACRYLGVTAPSQDYKPAGIHNSPWLFEPNIELGADTSL